MSFLGRPERNVIARQIAEALDAYKATVDDWIAKPGNADLYGKVSAEIEALRIMSSSALPQATGALTDLLLAHTVLTFIVLKKQLLQSHPAFDIAGEGQLVKAKERHESTVRIMHALCDRLSERERYGPLK